MLLLLVAFMVSGSELHTGLPGTHAGNLLILIVLSSCLSSDILALCPQAARGFCLFYFTFSRERSEVVLYKHKAQYSRRVNYTQARAIPV